MLGVLHVHIFMFDALIPVHLYTVCLIGYWYEGYGIGIGIGSYTSLMFFNVFFFRKWIFNYFVHIHVQFNNRVV